MAPKPLPNDITLAQGGPELLDRVSPLWSQLRHHHADLAPQWRDEFLTGSFDDRRAALIAKSPQGLLVSLATHRAHDIAYCVTTISQNHTGEIDSFYVSPPHRRLGIGDALISAALDWLTSHSVQSTAVGVIPNNPDAQRFYERYGFTPRTIRLLRSTPPAR